MNNSERLDLKQLLDKNTDYEDNTANIRKLKHSTKIRDDIREIDRLKKSEEQLKNTNFDDFSQLCRDKCPFLFNHYTDIFNKHIKDEIDLHIMTRLLIVLKMIEEDKLDQHEGSVMVGKILKELYIDSAIKHGDNLDKDNLANEEKIEKNDGKPISWSQYKRQL
jgi:hypothetical protein